MGLSSVGFFAFLPVFAAVYLHLPHKFQPAFLLAASAAFYLLAAPQMFVVTAGLAVLTYCLARGIGTPRRKVWLAGGVTALLAVLAFFKYGPALNAVLDLGLPSFAMPLGLSFYTFAAISYLVDAARGDCPVEKNFVIHALYILFFPTITSGPICRAGQLMPQLAAEHRFDAARTADALRLYALGTFKAVAVGRTLHVLVQQVVPNYRDYGGWMLMLAVLAYTFYLYFDFSGYSESARAAALMMGIQLPENFKTPFFATNFSGFWNRWHISFSSWLQDYLFMPLAWADVSKLTRGRRERLPVWLCLLCVFLVSGFWHGNTLPYVLWGLLQAVYRIGEEVLHRRLGKPKKKAPAAQQWGKRAVVFALWTFSMVFFCIGADGTLGTADCFGYLAGCVQGLSPARFAGELYSAVYDGFYPHAVMVAGYYAFLALALALAFRLDWHRNFTCKNRPAEQALAALPRRRAVYYLLIVCILAGLILSNGGFGSTNFSAYAGF